jgi:glycosyltransferase involved in cell wall biosynthesis
MAGPLVSVVMPAYNAAHLIGGAVRSVLDQTFTDYEAIVVDDGSQDDTREVVSGFVQGAGGRVRLITQPNGGCSAARNRGIAEARGAWIALLDADDEWRPKHLELLLAAAEAAPEAHLVYGSKVTVDEHGTPIQHNVVPRFPTGWIFADLVEDCLIQVSTTMVRRETLRALGGFDEDPRFKVTQDWDLYFRLSAEHPITASRDTHVAYRRLTQSLSHQIVPTVLGNIAALRTADQLLAEGRVAAANHPEKIDMKDRWRRAYEEAIVHTFTKGHYETARTLGAEARARGYLTRAAASRALLAHLPPHVLDRARDLARLPRRLTSLR